MILQSHILIFIAFIIPSAYLYNIDWPQALSTPLQQPPYSNTLKQIQLYYTIPQAFTLLLVFKLGIIFDSVKLNILLVIVPLTILATQTIIAISYLLSFQGVYYVNMICRVIFMIAGQATFILQAIVLLSLVGGKKASQLLGYGFIFSTIFETFNSFISPSLFSRYRLIYIPLFVGSGMCLIILLLCIYLGFKLKNSPQTQNIQSNPTDLQINRDFNTQPKKSKIPKNLLDQIQSFTLQFWFLQFLIFLMYLFTYVFVSNATDLIIKRFSIQYVLAGQLVAIPFLFAALISPLCNYLIKKFPYQRRNMFIIIMLAPLIAYIYLFFLPNSQNPGLLQYVSISLIFVMIGITASGLLMIVVPSVYLVSEAQETGAAFSFVAFDLCAAYIVGPSISSAIMGYFDEKGMGYKYSYLLYVGFSILGLITVLVMRLNNRFCIFDA